MRNNDNFYTSDDIYNTIKSSIVNFEYPPGMQLSENEIAKKFNVSRTPVKSVFTRLEMEGFLVVYPQRGTYVSMLNKQQTSDFIYMRMVLELNIVEKFMNQLDDQDILFLNSNIKRQKNIINCDEFIYMDFFNEDEAFHGYIFNKLGRVGIWNEIQKLKVTYTRFRMLDIKKPENFNRIYKEHAELLNAIIKKDIKLYKTLLACHLRSNFEKSLDSTTQEYFI